MNDICSNGMPRYIALARETLGRERRLAGILLALGWPEAAIVRVLRLIRAIERGERTR